MILALAAYIVLFGQCIEVCSSIFTTFTVRSTNFFDPPPIQGIVDAFGHINPIGLSETVGRQYIEFDRFFDPNKDPASSTTPISFSNPTPASTKVYYSSGSKIARHNFRRRWSDGRIFWQNLFPNLFDESIDDYSNSYNRRNNKANVMTTAAVDDGRSETTFRRKVDSPSFRRVWLKSDYASDRRQSSTISSWHAPFYAKNFAVDLAQGNENDDSM